MSNIDLPNSSRGSLILTIVQDQLDGSFLNISTTEASQHLNLKDQAGGCILIINILSSNCQQLKNIYEENRKPQLHTLFLTPSISQEILALSLTNYPKQSRLVRSKFKVIGVTNQSQLNLLKQACRSLKQLFRSY